MFEHHHTSSSRIGKRNKWMQSKRDFSRFILWCVIASCCRIKSQSIWYAYISIIWYVRLPRNFIAILNIQLRKTHQENFLYIAFNKRFIKGGISRNFLYSVTKSNTYIPSYNIDLLYRNIILRMLNLNTIAWEYSK